MKRAITLACAAAALLAGLHVASILAAPQDARDPDFTTYDVAELLKKRAESGRPYLPFMNVKTMHMGMYVLAKDAVDGQSPHGQDEVYYCLAGSGSIEMGTGEARQRHEVKEGSVIFVKAGVEHKFVSISDELQLLVFFSKAPIGP